MSDVFVKGPGQMGQELRHGEDPISGYPNSRLVQGRSGSDDDALWAFVVAEWPRAYRPRPPTVVAAEMSVALDSS